MCGKQHLKFAENVKGISKQKQTEHSRCQKFNKEDNELNNNIV